MRIDVWSDIVCPFCHLGRRHLELALARFEHADEVEVIWHSFELDRNAPRVGTEPVIEGVAAKYGVPMEQMVAQHESMAAAAAAVGLDFQWRRLVASNSYDAHRLIHASRAAGVETPVTDRIMRAWYSEGAAIGDPEVLAALAVEGGLAADVVATVLAGDAHGIDVRTDEALASEIGVSGVPTFVLDQKFAVTGAQPVDVLLSALDHTWADRGNRPEASAGGCGGGCCGGGCASDDALDGEGAATESAAGGCGANGCGCSATADAGCDGDVCAPARSDAEAHAASAH